jgi:hypothetical protein
MAGEHHQAIIADALDQVLVRGRVDWLQLVEVEDAIIQAARQHGVELWHRDPEVSLLRHDQWFGERLELTLTLLGRAFDQGLLEAGDVTPGFEVWAGAPADWIERIESGWRKLETQLSMGDVAWLNLTERGREATNQHTRR